MNDECRGRVSVPLMLMSVSSCIVAGRVTRLEEAPTHLAWGLSLAAILATSCGSAPQATSVPSQAHAAQAASAAAIVTVGSACDEKSGRCADGLVMKRVSLSKATACAVVGGRVACWGDNSRQIITGGSRGPQPVPVLIQGIAQAVSVQVGPSFGCAVTSEGKLFCFQGGSTHEIELLSGIKDAAIFDQMVIGVKKDGSLAAAILTSDARDVVPVAVPRLRDVVAVSAGIEHACALQSSGSVVCWGDPRYTGTWVDVEGIGVERYRLLASRAVKVQGLEDAVQLAVGDTHTCAVTRMKGLRCWGLNWAGGLGDGSTSDQYAAVGVQGIGDAEAVATGYLHTCVVRTSGGVSCFGENVAGQVGSSKPEAKGVIEVQGISGAVAVAAGDQVSCAALSGGGVSCWGSPSRGRLGNGSAAEYATPQPVKGISGAEMLSVSGAVSCSADRAGRVTCWGSGRALSLEHNEPDDAPKAAAALGEIDRMFVSSGNVCAVARAKDVFCGLGDRWRAALVPLKIGPVKALADLGSFGTAILPSGQLMLWRHKYQSQGPEGSVWTRNVTGLSDAVAVASEGDGLCAVRASGKVACVEFAYFKLFGPEASTSPTAPVEIPGVSDAVAIAGGAAQMCLLHKSGRVSCFRRAPPPLPPDPKRPATKGKAPPIKVEEVAGLTGVVQLGMDGHIRCALLGDGTVSCWGADNPYGALGTGDFEPRSGPVPVAGLTDVARLAVSSGHVCAARKNGEVLCWGSNSGGEIGRRAQPFAITPVSVLLPVVQ